MASANTLTGVSNTLPLSSESEDLFFLPEFTFFLTEEAEVTLLAVLAVVPVPDLSAAIILLSTGKITVRALTNSSAFPLRIL